MKLIQQFPFMPFWALSDRVPLQHLSSSSLLGLARSEAGSDNDNDEQRIEIAPSPGDTGAPASTFHVAPTLF